MQFAFPKTRFGECTIALDVKTIEILHKILRTKTGGIAQSK
jgi:hypothetical protein